MALDKTQKKLAAMLDAEDPLVKQAAAIVLGELGVKDRSVVASLLAMLAIRDRDMRLSALHGLRGAKSKAAAPMILPLLESRDEGRPLCRRRRHRCLRQRYREGVAQGVRHRRSRPAPGDHRCSGVVAGHRVVQDALRGHGGRRRGPGFSRPAVPGRCAAVP